MRYCNKCRKEIKGSSYYKDINENPICELCASSQFSCACGYTFAENDSENGNQGNGKCKRCTQAETEE